jgi:hypothetical protein
MAVPARKILSFSETRVVGFDTQCRPIQAGIIFGSRLIELFLIGGKVPKGTKSMLFARCR